MIASWRYGSYRIMAVIVMVVFVFTGMAVAVSADYATVNNFGLYYEIGSSTLTKVNVGDTIPNQNNWSVRWALTGLSPDYTYDIFFDCGFSSAVDCTGNTFSPKDVYYSTQQEYLSGYLFNYPAKYNWNILSDFNGSIEQLSDNRIRFHVYYNYNLSGLKLSQLQLAFSFKCFNWSGTMINLTYMSQGVGAYYDPGGSNYEEILNDIKNQLHAGDDKLDNIPTNNIELETKVSEIESVESSIVSASDPDGDAVDKFAEQGKSAVSTVNTSYRATFAFINGLVTKVMDDLGFGTIVFVSLTLGLVSYILGRIK